MKRNKNCKRSKTRGNLNQKVGQVKGLKKRQFGFHCLLNIQYMHGIERIEAGNIGVRSRFVYIRQN